MNISGTTVVLVNGKPTRVLGSRFNRALRLYTRGVASAIEGAKRLAREHGGMWNPSTTRKFVVQDLSGKFILPSKNLTWAEVGKQVRAGKKVVAKVA